jgi:hypothetical protein
MSSRLESAPPTTFRAFGGPADTILEMRKAVLSPRGEQSIRVRSFTESCVRGLQPKDYLSEIIAVRNAVAAHVRYLNDPVAVELVKDPERIVEEIEATGRGIGDCDDIATLIATMERQLGRETEFVTVGFGAPGNFSHVFVRVKDPKSGKWIVCDPVAGTQEDRMLSRVTTHRTWRID